MSNKDYINKIIADKISELQETVLHLKADKRAFTSSVLIDQTKEKYQEKTIDEFFLSFIQQLEAENKVGNCHFYRRTYNSIKTFTKGRLDIPFSAIDTNWLSRYEKWLRSKQNKETSISIVFRTFRSLYNKAIDQHCARKSDYPFDDYKLCKFDVTTPKRAITKIDIINIYNMPAPDSCKSPYFELSKDIFMFSYLCGGINFVDIANLRKENIKDGRLTYIRQKTGKRIKITQLHRHHTYLKHVQSITLQVNKENNGRIAFFAIFFWKRIEFVLSLHHLISRNAHKHVLINTKVLLKSTSFLESWQILIAEKEMAIAPHQVDNMVTEALIGWRCFDIILRCGVYCFIHCNGPCQEPKEWVEQ